jgi:pilus assembly protein CpaF
MVIQQSRLPNGKRGIVKISEVQGMEGDVVVLQDLFERPEGGGALLQGPFGPSFLKDLEATGYHWPNHLDPSPK